MRLPEAYLQFDAGSPTEATPMCVPSFFASMLTMRL